jgi:putative lipoic acid-binding regulatory protein
MEIIPMQEFELNFPCEYAIKVIGVDENDFQQFVLEVAQRHINEIFPETISSRSSRESNYLSVSLGFLAESRAQLDALYAELGADPRVKIIL